MKNIAITFEKLELIQEGNQGFIARIFWPGVLFANTISVILIFSIALSLIYGYHVKLESEDSLLNFVRLYRILFGVIAILAFTHLYLYPAAAICFKKSDKILISDSIVDVFGNYIQRSSIESINLKVNFAGIGVLLFNLNNGQVVKQNLASCRGLSSSKL
ncbi:hypothetical protein [Novosphingobium sp. FSW06-99]|uniref:hypothetical protein n=1 Tax=Novosphingobium sp. FSW06-99 TaxID=1739113 RepID=UPI0012E3BE49|nr:hypothetical protein [Novosphingobium sp. FSW06-99]